MNTPAHTASPYIAVIFLMLISLPPELFAQTCSCAGAPLISSGNVSAVSKGNLLVGLTYQFNEISKLYSGSDQLDNRSTYRNTQSTLFEFNYGITDRLTLSGTATFVRKLRESGLQNPNTEEELTTNGLGDGLFMLKYVLHENTFWEQYELSLGGGVKVPFGQSDLTIDGLPLNADMQPGTGAWDGVIWSYVSKTFVPTTNLNLFWYNSYRLTGENDRFGANDTYEFGNELVSTLGVSNKLAGNFSYIMMIRYRSTSSDQRNSNSLPNTGGKWVNLKPAVAYGLSDRISLQVSGQLPVYQHLNGVQPTTAFTLSGSVYYRFGKQNIFETNF
jgi:hypothetical protein